jgi:hypothetical protein
MVCAKCEGAMIFEQKGQHASPYHCALVEIPHTESDRDVAVLARDVLEEAAKLSQ